MTSTHRPARPGGCCIVPPHLRSPHSGAPRASLGGPLATLLALWLAAGGGVQRLGAAGAKEEAPLPAGERPLTGKPWIDMDYGPFFTLTLEVAEKNLAFKGIAIRLDEGPGGVASGEEFVVFETDTLRCAAGWSGSGPCDWHNINKDGSHQTHMKIVGDRLFANPIAPGWGRPEDGSFEDPRLRGRDGIAYGPLPRRWAHYKGLYRDGRRVVLSYTVGDAAVLESPSSRGTASLRAFARAFDIGARSRDLVLQVAADPDARIELREGAAGSAPLAIFLPPAPGASPAGARGMAFDGATSLEVEGADAFDLHGGDFTILARVRTRSGGTIFAEAPRNGKWAHDGKTFFVRGGRLCFDIGWVGVVTSNRAVNDGKWHEVAATFERSAGTMRLFVDGEPVGEKELAAHGPLENRAIRIGFTSPDFPSPSAFEGEIREVRFWSRRLEGSELSGGAPEDASSGRGLVARWNLDGAKNRVVADATGGGHAAVRKNKRAVAATHHSVLAVALAGGPEGLAWITAAGGHLRLRVPAGEAPARFEVIYAPVGETTAGKLDPFAKLESFAKLVASTPAPGSLEPLTHGGPPFWARDIVVEGRRGSEQKPFAIDDLGAPMKNPWHSWMRLGGLDFFPDGRIAACTWDGDVWIVSGIDDSLEHVTWRRIAGGLFQGLGLKVVGGEIYVLGRDQITRLHDLNGDGEADFYESFNNDAQVTDHFHEFAMDLQTDANGDFYYMRGGRHALDAVVPQHGTLLKVSRDGSRTEILANGFRAPDGLCVNDDGTFLSTDQEGHWTPANRINWIEPGKFYGYMWSYHQGEPPKTYSKPLVWMHPKCDRSPAEPIWVRSPAWGVLDGKLLEISYGTGHVWLVLWEEVEGQRQGGVIKLPSDTFPTGIQRGRWGPKDRQLYLAGLFGWSGNCTRAGGLYRLRRTERPLDLPVALHSTRSGVVLRFSDPLDERRSADPRRFSVERWNYRWAARYGSQDFKVSDGKVGRDKVTVESVRISKDRKSLFLRIADMCPCMQMLIRYRLAGADRSRLSQEIYHTIYALGDDAPYRKEFGL